MRSWLLLVWGCVLSLNTSHLLAEMDDDNMLQQFTSTIAAPLNVISPHFSEPHYFIPSLVRHHSINFTNSSTTPRQHRPDTPHSLASPSSFSTITKSSTFIAPYIGYNYYPSAYGWGAMWKQFEEALPVMRYELSVFPSANLLRIFIDFQIFGAGLDCPTDNFNHLEQFLTLAASNSLSVVVTLFDGDIDAALSNSTLTENYLDCLLSRYAHDSRIVLWDLINEPDGRGFVDPNVSPDPDHDPTKGWNPTALHWLIHVYQYVRSLSPYGPPSQPCSIGTVLDSGWLVDLCAMKDNTTGLPIFGKTVAEFVPQYHEYSPFSGKVADEAAFTEKLKNDFDIVYTQCGERPVFIGEFGTPSNYSTSLSLSTIPLGDQYHHRQHDDPPSPALAVDDIDAVAAAGKTGKEKWRDDGSESVVYPPFPDTEPYTELYQAHKYYLFFNFTTTLQDGVDTNKRKKKTKKYLHNTTSSKLWGVTVWTLNDFVHASGTGEMYFGIVRSLRDYSFKPSASILQQFLKPTAHIAA